MTKQMTSSGLFVAGSKCIYVLSLLPLHCLRVQGHGARCPVVLLSRRRVDGRDGPG